MSLPEVTEIRRWRLDPGDRLVVTMADGSVSPADIDRIKATVRQALALPDGFPVLVTGPGISVEVVTP